MPGEESVEWGWGVGMSFVILFFFPQSPRKQFQKTTTLRGEGVKIQTMTPGFILQTSLTCVLWFISLSFPKISCTDGELNPGPVQKSTP